MDAIEAINSRSSAKTFGDTAPTREHIDIVLQAAVRAPDHGRLRPWRFMLIQGDQRQKLGEMLAASALRRIPGLGEGDLQRERGKALRAPLIIVEAATDNPTRTVAQVRAILSKGGGNLGSTGSVAFQFRKMGVFRLNPEGIDHDDLELYLIDHGLDEMGDSVGEKGEPQIVARCLFPEFGHLQEALEKRGIHPLSATHEYICTTPVELPEAQATEVLELIDTLEQNDDVQHVYHSLV